MENIPELELQPLNDNGKCFGCGKDNVIGLKLKFNWDGKTAKAEFIPTENLQGWSGYLHGGITACVLDEAMGWVAMYAGAYNVTAKMQVRYRRMVPIGQTCIVSCTITRETSRLIETAAFLTDVNGTVFAEGTSTQFIVGQMEKKDRLS